jgi:hypothetical protein
VQKYLQEFNDNEKSARVSLLKIDHIYYKNDLLYSKIAARLSEKKKSNPAEEVYMINGSTERYINE